MRTSLLMLTILFSWSATSSAQRDPFVLQENIEIPALQDFTPLPEPDEEFSELLGRLVKLADLDGAISAEESPFDKDDVSSFALVDLSDLDNPRVASWNGDHLIYPASTYKMYVMGEAIRQVVAEEISLDDVRVMQPHNVRGGSRPVVGEELTVSEILRLTMQYSDNTTANEAIDLVDRQRASALMHALGCEGSEITRKFLGRDLEDEGYSGVRATETSALHAATFLWATETGAIGGGKGRGLIKGYLAMNDRGRFYRGLPESATIHSKTGFWNTFTSEAAIIEDGTTRYILCALTVYTTSVAEPRMADFAARVHALMQGDEERAFAEAASE